MLAGAVINALRYELHDTGTVRGMTADFPKTRTAQLPVHEPESAESEPPGRPTPNSAGEFLPPSRPPADSGEAGGRPLRAPEA